MMSRFGVYLAVLFLSACAPQSGDEVEPDPPSPPPTAPPVTPPSTPPTTSNTAPSIETTSLSGREGVELSVRIAASDSDGDEITFSLIEGPDWLQVSPTGEVSGTPGESAIGIGRIEVEADDGKDTSRAEITVTIAYDPLEQALRTGDYTIIENETSFTPAEAMLEELDNVRDSFNADIAQIFQLSDSGSADENSLTDLTWQPGENVAWFTPRFGTSAPLFISNATSEANREPIGFPIGVLGRTDESRFVAFGDNPMRNAIENPTSMSDDMQQALKNTFAWLLGRDPESGFKVVISSMAYHSNYQDNRTTRTWLDDAFGSSVEYNRQFDCDGARIADCLTDDVDLIIVASYEPDQENARSVSSSIEGAMARGVPVLHFHSPGGASTLGNQMADLLGIEFRWDNSQPHPTLSKNSPIDAVYSWQPEWIIAFERLVERIEAGAQDYTLYMCSQYWDCPENNGYFNEVAKPLREIDSLLNTWANKPLFPATDDGKRWWGLLILTGDQYRSQTKFPMNKASTSSFFIVRAMFGDIANIINRKINPAVELGTYSRREFPSSVRTNKAVRLDSQRPYRTTGVYAVPGETVTVTRTDVSDVQVWLRVQALRPNANAPFRDDFDRPVFIRSRAMSIEPGETREFTSAYGGPIHAHFSSDGSEIELDFQNIGEHPVWWGLAGQAEFERRLALDEFDWVEFVTPFFEINSTREKMLETLGKEYVSNATNLMDLTDVHIRDWPHWLAGWEGPGIQDNPDLQAFAAQNGLTIPTTDIVKHMNADRAACGRSAPNCTGTSGNPYDTKWAYDPLNLIDLHELGHGLEHRRRHHFEGGDATHSTTDIYAYHSNSRYFVETGVRPARCLHQPHQRLYETIQASRSQPNPAQYMRDADLSAFNEQSVMFVQLFAALENQGALDDGWKMMPRLNLVTREFKGSYAEDTWAVKAAGLGFEGMSRDTAFALSQNDWLLIALSWSAQRDLRSYLDMWGYNYSDMARNHVAQMGFPSLFPAFYAMGGDGQCRGLNHPELPIDGTTSWPTQTVQQKSGPFTPDYLAFDHGEFCTLEDHNHDSETPLMSLAPETE